MRSFYVDHPFTFPAGVRDRPLQAKYERIDVRSTNNGQITQRVKQGTVYRDTAGRSRREFVVVAPDPSMPEIIIDDPVKKYGYILDVESKTAFSMSLEDASDEELEFTGDDIGHKIIEGFACRGYRMTQSDGAVMEYWVAEDLLEILSATYRQGEMESTVRHFDIQHIEPNSEMFAIPDDYEQANA